MITIGLTIIMFTLGLGGHHLASRLFGRSPIAFLSTIMIIGIMIVVCGALIAPYQGEMIEWLKQYIQPDISAMSVGLGAGILFGIANSGQIFTR